MANRQIADAVCIVLSCDDFTCLCVAENNLISLPSSRILSNIYWKDQAAKDIKEATGIEIPPSNPFRIYKIWIPNHPTLYVQTCIFHSQIGRDIKAKMKAPAGKFANRLRWVSESELQKYYKSDSLCAHVLLEIYPKIVTEKTSDFRLFPSDVIVFNSLVEVGENSLVEGTSNAYDLTVEASGLKPLQSALYKEFMTMASPNFVLAPPPFCKLMSELGIPKEDAVQIFRAADLTNRKFLSFREFLYILAILEPVTNHGGISGEIRCRYIFRFFDKDRDSVMSYNELKDMIIYMRKGKNLPVDAANVEKEQKAYATVLNVSLSKGLSLVDFLKFAGELKIRGLSQILRLPKTIKIYIQSLMNREARMSMGRIISMDNAPTKPTLKIGDFEIAAHTVHIQKSGTMINIQDIWSIKGVASMTTLQQANITRESRKVSCDINSQDSVCNDLIKTMRSLIILNKAKSGNRGNRKEQYQWGAYNSLVYAQKLTTVCNSLKNIFKAENRLLELRSPLYVLGDFHGNYGDLQFFERMFWPLGPGFCPCGLLFLGDYVDRGNFSIEVVTYLFCYKLLYPLKMHLLRGNHEIREIQKTFTFHTECMLKFGEKVGNELWETINATFDFMPLAAIIDGKIFCCHGGIPPPWLCPVATAINSIPVPLSEPDTQSSLAWELLWNDPIKDRQITPEINAELKVNEGFAMNVRRGTAHVFNSDGLDRFLNINGLTHVVRAHEMVQSGYNVLLKGKLVTIFSTSKYSGQNNEAACILIDMGKLRMMRLDTITS